jgi:hypothetical protein
VKNLVHLMLLTVISVLLFAVLWPIVAGERRPLVANVCLSHLKQMAISIQMYATDHDDRLPGAKWMDLHVPYSKSEEVLHCPVFEKGVSYGYAFDSRLLNQKTTTVPKPAEAPLVFDSTSLARNSADPFTSLPDTPRHNKTNVVGYLDGHAHRLPPKAQNAP